MKSAVVEPNVASIEELGIIIDELSAMRRQLTSLEASVGSVKHDVGFVRDCVATQHETLMAGISQSSFSSANNLVTTSMAPLVRRASRCEATRNRPTFSRVPLPSTNATTSVGLGLGSSVTENAQGETRVTVLAKMAEDEVRKILQCNSEQIIMAHDQSMKAHTRLGGLRNAPFLVNLVKNTDRQHFENVMDSVVGFIIVLNALFLGMSADADNSSEGAFLAVDVTFSAIFWLELIIKVLVKDWRSQYCGNDRFANILDALLIFIDSIQLFLLLASDLIKDNSIMDNSRIASLFRIVRLLRLARILRLLRSRVFQDLLSMIHVMLGGLATLFWSVVLFVLFIYVVSLIFRHILGPNKHTIPEDELELKVQKIILDLPRSMYTMFRCSFGDCTTDTGTPIFEHVTEVHGGIWSVVYSCFNFMVVIGLFNVISAIFVENTMQAAAQLQASKRQQRLNDESCWAVNFVILLRALLLRMHGQTWEIDQLTEGRCIHQMILKAEFPQDDFDDVLKEDHSAKHALIELDIDPQDNKYLSDILDSDHGGTIGVLELVDGLKRLRGEPRRSDTIAIDLMVCSLQEKVDDIWRGMGSDTSKKQQIQDAAAGPAWRLVQLGPQTVAHDLMGVYPNERVSADL